MQKRTVVLVFVFLVSFATTAIKTVKPQHTESGEGFPLASPITIISPVNSNYNSNELNLGVSFRFLLSSNYAQVRYSIDGKNCTLALTGTKKTVKATRTNANGTTMVVNSTFMVPFTITRSVVLPPLENGPNNISVYTKYIANSKIELDTKSLLHHKRRQFKPKHRTNHRISRMDPITDCSVHGYRHGHHLQVHPKQTRIGERNSEKNLQHCLF